MMTKLYEVTCDMCGGCINHFMGKKPSSKELREDGIIVRGDKQFCNEHCMRLYYAVNKRKW